MLEKVINWKPQIWGRWKCKLPLNIYEDIFTEIEKGANDKAKYSMTVGSFLEDLGQVFTEENIEKIKVLVEKAIENQKEEE